MRFCIGNSDRRDIAIASLTSTWAKLAHVFLWRSQPEPLGDLISALALTVSWRYSSPRRKPRAAFHDTSFSDPISEPSDVL
jgi:hypothetical protein